MLLEFTVPGPPVSHQSHNKTKLRAWRGIVRQSAAKVWGSRPRLESNLTIVVTYYHPRQAILFDTDNIVKPIQDALIGLVYKDDSWITHTVCQKKSIDGFFQIRGLSLILLEAFSQGVEFLYITVDHEPSYDSPEVVL
jgi:crossover junction endodeoxyribonuclease RusA